MNEDIQKLKDRIEKLEQHLMFHGIPYEDRTCECCKNLYLPDHYDSCRCISCCNTCCYNREERKWIQGSGCPSKRKK